MMNVVTTTNAGQAANGQPQQQIPMRTEFYINNVPNDVKGDDLKTILETKASVDWSTVERIVKDGTLI